MDEHMIYGSVSLVLVFAALVYHKLQGRERFFSGAAPVYHRLIIPQTHFVTFICLKPF